MPNDSHQNDVQADLDSSGRYFRRIVLRRRNNGPAPTDNTAADVGDGEDQSVDANIDLIDPADLTDADVTDRLRVTCDMSSESTLLQIEGLLDWPSTARLNLFRFLANFDQDFRIRASDDGEQFIDAFEFLLSQMVDAADVARCQAGRDAAIEAAAIIYPTALAPACNRIVSRLRQLGLRGVHTEEILREARALAESIPDAMPLQQPTTVTDALPGCPASSELVVPPGWDVSHYGVSNGGGRVLGVPVVITGRLVADDGQDFMEISFHRDGSWHSREIAREKIATPHGVLTLARVGIPVNVTNARILVQYFADFEDANREVLPVRRLVDRMGWHRDGDDHVFVLGETIITSATPSSEDQLGTDGEPVVDVVPIVFRSRTEGDTELANAIRTAGTYDAWLNAIAVIEPYSHAKLAFYASLTPAVLPILVAPSFCLDFCGPTSSGKTTALRVAAANWGCPDETQGTILLNWDTTPAFRQRVARMLGNVPLILDETRLAISNDEVVQTVYSIVSGRGRGRGGRGGIQNRDSWATALITSGESPVTEMTNKGGARARVCSVWGSPFGQTDRATAALVGELNRGLAANYGFAGRALVQYLARYHGMWPTWRQEYRDRVAELERRAGDNAVACRMAAFLAAISITARLTHEALENLPWRNVDVVDQLWDTLTEHSADANRAAAALEHALDRRVIRAASLILIDRAAEHRGAAGPVLDLDGDFVGFRPEVLRRVLTAGNFEFDATVRTWRDRNWILCDPSSGKARHRTRIDNQPLWVIAIRQSAIREIDG